MSFEKIISQAWKIIWKNKVLWIFSLISLSGALVHGGVGGLMGIASFLIAIYLDGSEAAPGQTSPLWNQKIFFQIQHIIEDGTLWVYIAPIIVSLIGVTLLLSAVFLALRTIGNIGLVRGIWIADEGQNKITFSDLSNESRHYFWRVLLFSLGLTLLAYLVGTILILFALLVMIVTLGIGTQCLTPLVAAVSWPLQTLVELIMVAMIGEDLDIIPAVKRAWGIFIGRLGFIILMTLLLFMGQMILGNIIAMPMILVMFPIYIGILAGTKIATAVGFLIGGLGVFIYILLLILFYSGAMRAFLTTVWTLVFRRLTGREAGETSTPVDDAPQEPPLPETAAA